MAFVKKTIAAGETVGRYLTELMREEGMTAEKIAEALHLQVRHVRAVLTDQASELPGAFYTKHLVRQLTALLHGNVEYAEKVFLRSASDRVAHEAPEKVFERKRVRAANLIVVARLLTGSALALVLAVLLFSFGGNIRNALTPPMIVLMNPSTDLVTTTRELRVEGKTEPEVTLKVNGEQVVTDTAGVFSVPLYLADGLNVIEIRAAKRYSKDQVVYRRVLVEPKAVSQR